MHLQVLHEPCYDTLRTKQQLGYSVHSGVRLTHGILGFAVCVVSGTLYTLQFCLPECKNVRNSHAFSKSCVGTIALMC